MTEINNPISYTPGNNNYKKTDYGQQFAMVALSTQAKKGTVFITFNGRGISTEVVS